MNKRTLISLALALIIIFAILCVVLVIRQRKVVKSLSQPKTTSSTPSFQGAIQQQPINKNAEDTNASGSADMENTNSSGSATCPQDQKQCADGSYVSRRPPTCEFDPCPVVVPENTSPTGGTKDEHGCIGSAGYQWCPEKNKCLRIWKESCPSLKK